MSMFTFPHLHINITLRAPAAFMGGGNFRKDSHRRYELATRICLIFMIKAREREREKVTNFSELVTSANGTYNGFKFHLSIFMASKSALT